jgi:alkylhydroperoxidase family enzyme
MAATPAVVGDELFAELQRHFTEAQLVELVSDLAMGNMRSRFNRAFLCRPAGFSEGAFCPLPET